MSPLIMLDDITVFYDFRVFYAIVVQKIEFYASMVFVSLSLINYLCIIAHLVWLKCKMSTQKVQSKELKLLIAALIEFCLCSCLNLSWHFGRYVLPNSVWTGTVVNALIILHCGWINPGLNLILSR
ncbi:hypothetical protein L596_020795 [Steinernema carpocapsae]|uniref:7TM GPCR serpentine receptor class x (Srx) domain-containing protein n=1 Tax=Steinernema carpocapsae TaxID=34508 RepID=A0A4U5MUN1_STECR|nr:hypothetical protein L596_020720 [Steinernema carpocapsae]TKR73490.1 hypothetical protein L596_020795 [Steinernema carpocapsae]